MRIVQITGIFYLALIGLCSFYTLKVKDDKSYHLQIDDMHFEITFPVGSSHVKDLTNFQLTNGEEIKVYNYLAVMQGTSDENLSYQIVAHKISGIYSDGDIEQLFDDGRDKVIDDMRMKMDSVTTVTIESEENIDLNGVKGRYWAARVKHPEMIKDIVLYNKFYYSNGCVYKMMIMHRNSNFPNKPGTKFFNSFKILKN
jgi:hypothetical protein